MSGKSGGAIKRRNRSRRAPPPVPLPDTYDVYVDDSRSQKPEETKAGLLELTVWPPHQGERGSNFPLWCDLRFQCLEESFDNKWRIKVSLTRAELIANFVGCKPARGTLYGDEPLPPDETMMKRQVKEIDIQGAEGLHAEISATAVGGLLASLRGYVRRIRKTSFRTASQMDSKIKRSRIAVVPARGVGKIWQITDPREGILRGTYLRAPAEDESKARPLCKVIPVAPRFNLSLGLEIRSGDIDFEFIAIDRNWILPWRRKERPNANAVIQRLISKALVEGFNYEEEGRHRVASASLRGRRKIAKDKGGR
jgi:hypothetical protein